MASSKPKPKPKPKPKRTRKTKSEKVVYGVIEDCFFPDGAGIVALYEKDAKRLKNLYDVPRDATWGSYKANLTAENRTYFEAYIKDMYYEGEGPDDSDVFYFDSVPGYEDGDWPEKPMPNAHRFLPECLFEMAQDADTIFNGTYCWFAVADEKKLIKTLNENGYAASRDDALLWTVSGYL